MELTTEIINGIAYIKLCGELDSERAGEDLSQAIVTAAKKSTEVIVDLNSVNVINSFGVGKLLYCNKAIKEKNGVLKLYPMQEGVIKELISLVFLDQVIPYAQVTPYSVPASQSQAPAEDAPVGENQPSPPEEALATEPLPEG